ncbi:MAG: hypothetical protein PHP50_10130 [Lachnospiraceae bacterium]|nr:hypothetical protein [Lachnospiraceae bacterium]
MKPVVNIYAHQTIKGPKSQNGIVGYVLETETADGPRTKTGFALSVASTKHKAELYSIILPLRRMKKPSVLSIYADSGYIETAFKQGWIDNWKENGWKTAHGNPIENIKEWKEMAKLLNAHEFQIISGAHSYTTWLERESEKWRDICLIDLESLTVQRN